MIPPTRQRGPVANEAPPKSNATATTQHVQRDGSAAARPLPVVTGELLARAGRRHLDALLVRSCPYCQHAHLHRTGNPNAGAWTREGSCGAGEYLIRLVPAQRRRSA